MSTGTSQLCNRGSDRLAADQLLLVFWSFLLTFLVFLPLPADEIILHSGTRYYGKVLSKNKKRIRVKTRNMEFSLPRSRIKKIIKGPPPWKAFPKKLKKIPGDAHQKKLKLVEWGLKRSLTDLVVPVLQKLVKQKSTRERSVEILNELGYREKEGNWVSTDDYYREKGYEYRDGNWISPGEQARKWIKKRYHHRKKEALASLKSISEKLSTRKSRLDKYRGEHEKQSRAHRKAQVKIKQLELKIESLRDKEDQLDRDYRDTAVYLQSLQKAARRQRSKNGGVSATLRQKINRAKRKLARFTDHLRSVRKKIQKQERTLNLRQKQERKRKEYLKKISSAVERIQSDVDKLSEKKCVEQVLANAKMEQLQSWYLRAREVVDLPPGIATVAGGEHFPEPVSFPYKRVLKQPRKHRYDPLRARGVVLPRSNRKKKNSGILPVAIVLQDNTGGGKRKTNKKTGKKRNNNTPSAGKNSSDETRLGVVLLEKGPGGQLKPGDVVVFYGMFEKLKKYTLSGTSESIPYFSIIRSSLQQGDIPTRKEARERCGLSSDSSGSSD